MIRREDICELAEFQSPEGCAVTFYYQPGTPQNKSHREEAILAKDLVRETLREAEKNGNHGCVRADLERILEVAERLRGNGGRAKAVFACGKDNVWKEFDLPARLAATRLFLSRRFRLKPLAVLLDQEPRLCIALVDRSKARFFDLSSDAIHEREKWEDELPRRGRSDGFFGYDAGHADRHVEHEAMHHFKRIADRLKEYHEHGSCERLIIGCRDETWPEFEPHLHTYSRERLVGHFAVDPATATADQVRQRAERLLAEYRENRRQGLIREVVGEAHRNARGAVGLRRVLRSLESGEVQALLLGRNFAAKGVECLNCGHIDLKMASDCSVCGHPTFELQDMSDAIIRSAIRNGIELVHIGDDAEFEKIGNIAALLRFRADQNTPMKLAV